NAEAALSGHADAGFPERRLADPRLSGDNESSVPAGQQVLDRRELVLAPDQVRLRHGVRFHPPSNGGTAHRAKRDNRCEAALLTSALGVDTRKREEVDHAEVATAARGQCWSPGPVVRQVGRGIALEQA